jgi:hypothetical protein
MCGFATSMSIPGRSRRWTCSCPPSRQSCWSGVTGPGSRRCRRRTRGAHPAVRIPPRPHQRAHLTPTRRGAWCGPDRRARRRRDRRTRYPRRADRRRRLVRAAVPAAGRRLPGQKERGSNSEHNERAERGGRGRVLLAGRRGVRGVRDRQATHRAMRAASRRSLVDMAVLPVRAVGPVAAGMPIIEAAAVVLVVRPTAAARMCSCSAARRVHDRDRGIGSMSMNALTRRGNLGGCRNSWTTAGFGTRCSTCMTWRTAPGAWN